MYDALWEEHPKVRKTHAEGFAEGFARSFVKSFGKYFAGDFAKVFGESTGEYFAEDFAKSFAKGFGEHFAKSIAEGEERREVAALQRALVSIVSARFPTLSDMALLEVKQFNKPRELDQLIQQAAMAPDEATARKLLLSPPAV